MAVRAADIELYFHSNVRGAIQGVNQLDNAVGKVGNRMRWFDAFATAIAGRALTQKIFGAVDEAIQFETELNKVNSIAKVTDAQLRSFGVTLEDMAMEWGQAPVTMAAALYEVQSAGFAAADGLKILDAANKAAVAGASDSQVAADALTSTINAYGTSAEQAEYYANIMFRTVDRGKITFAELASTIGDNVALAAQTGVSFEELGAAFAMATQKGVPFNEVSTQINAILSSFLKPSQDMVAALEAQGYASGEALLKSEGLAGALKFLQDATGGSEEALALLLPNIRALRGAVALMGGDFDGFVAAMEDAQGGMGELSAMESALEEQTKSTSFHLNRLKAAFSVLKIEVMTGALPAVKAMADALTVVTKAIARLPEPIRNVIALMAAMTAGFVAVYGLLVLFGPAIGTVVSALALAIPIIGALAAALVALSAAWSSDFFGIKSIVTDVVDSVVGKIESVKKALGPILDLFGALSEIQGEEPWNVRNKALPKFRAELLKLGFSAQTVRDLSDAFGQLHLPIRRVAAGWGQFLKVGKQSGRFLRGETINFKKFNERLENIFGEGVAKKYHDAIFRMRRAFRGLGKEVMSSLFGIDPNTPAGERKAQFLRKLAGYGDTLAGVFRSEVLPAVGRGMAVAMNLAADAAIWLTRNLDTILDVAGRVAGVFTGTLGNAFDFVSSLLRGDLSGALDAVVDQLQLLLDEVVIPLGGWMIDVGIPTLIGWVGDAAGWLVRELGEFLFGKRVQSPDGTDATGSLQGGIVIPLASWIVNVAAPTLLGWVEEAATWLYDNLKKVVDAALETAVEAGSWTVNVAAPTVAGWAGAGAGWLRGKILGLLGLGGGERGAHAIAFGQENAIDLGTVALSIKDALLTAIDEAGSIATQFYEWGKQQVFSLEEYAVSVGAPSQDGVTIDWSTILDKVAAAIDDAWTVSGNTADVVEAKSEAIGKKVGELVGAAIIAGINAIFTDDGSSFGGDGGGDMNAVDLLGEALKGFVKGFFEGAFERVGDGLLDFTSSDFETWMADADFADFAKVFGEFIVENFNKMLNPGQWVAELGLGGENGKVAQFINELFNGKDLYLGGGMFANDGSGLKQLFKDEIERLLIGDGSLFSDISSLLAGIANPFQGLIDSMGGWITDTVESLQGSIDGIPEWAKKLLMGDLVGAIKAMGGGGGPATGANRSFPILTGVPMEGFFPGPSANENMGADPYGPQPVPQRFTIIPKLTNDDLSGEVAALAKAALGGLGESPAFTAKFDADVGAVAKSYTDVFTWGEAWAAQTFRAVFDIDNGPAAIAYTEAFGWGAVWASQVFTATFSVNLGPLEAAVSRVREIAQEISDLLPNSPARKGPLARDVSFAYVADNLLATMNRMRGIASGGMAGVAGALAGGLGGFSGRAPAVIPVSNSQPVVNNWFVLKSDEFVAMQRNAEAGGNFARSFGHGARTKLTALGSK